MSEPTNHESKRAEIDPIRNRLVDLAATYHKISSDYALTILRSAFVVNGGALLAMPAYVVAVKGSANSVTAYSVTLAAAAFVGGIILAALASLSAYLNFQYHANFHHCDAEIKIIEIEETYDDATYHRNRSKRNKNIEYYKKFQNRYQKLCNISFWFGIILGFATYISFCAGCYYSGKLLLL